MLSEHSSYHLNMCTITAEQFGRSFAQGALINKQRNVQDMDGPYGCVSLTPFIFLFILPCSAWRKVWDITHGFWS